jgi:hypothetical protein
MLPAVPNVLKRTAVFFVNILRCVNKRVVLCCLTDEITYNYYFVFFSLIVIIFFSVGIHVSGFACKFNL